MPLYTLGLQKTVMIVGLGNIGKKYDGTRHNIGFACIDALAESQNMHDWTDKKDLKAIVSMGMVGNTRVILCKPTTMMNLSGNAVQAVSHFYKVDVGSICAVYDEVDITFGQIRTRLSGSSAGHNGVKSLIEQLGEDFARVRVGVGPKTPKQIDSADFVLAKFTATEKKQLTNLFQESNAILSEYIHSAQIPVETRSFLV